MSPAAKVKRSLFRQCKLIIFSYCLLDNYYMVHNTKQQFAHNSLVFDGCGSRNSFMFTVYVNVYTQQSGFRQLWKQEFVYVNFACPAGRKGLRAEYWKSTHYHFLDESRLIRNLLCRKIRCCCRHCFLSYSFLAAGLLRQKVSFVGLPSGKIMPLVSEIFSMQVNISK